MNNWKAIGGIVGAGIVMAGLIVWIVYFKTPTITPDTTQPQFGTGGTNGSTSVTPVGTTNEAQTVAVPSVSTQKVFKISPGPIAGAVLMETTRPTSTIARFVLANSGHTFDFAIDTPGAVPKAISNTTIPGIAKVIWSEEGRGALLQYIDGEVIKTLHLALPPAATSSSSSVGIQFLATGAKSVSVSPDGTSIAYLVTTSSGSDGYIARPDGGSPKKLFSLPFSQLFLSWPAQGTLLAQTPSAAGVQGASFSIDAKSGTATALLSAPGLTVTADRTFNRVVYQTNGEDRGSYVLTIRTGVAVPLSFDPMPELCRWSLVASSTLYCATPLSYVAPSYLDLWHLGAASSPSSLISFDVSTGRSTIVATPGSTDGGEQADIAEITVSKNDDYLLFIRKSDRSLWGVRLKN